ncbi:MAG: lipid II flippase MurJ [Ilumatobacteraceae bacterium]
MSSPASTRTPLPEGTLPVAAALLIAGTATYAFFKIGTWAVGGEDEFNSISALWFATFALAPGFFIPLEQELGRALAHRRAIGQGGRPVVQRILRLGLILVAVVVIAILCLSPIITADYFDGDWVMLVALVVAFAAYAPAHVARGISSGSGRFRSYAIVLGTDGVVRIVLCVALAVIGISSTGPYGFAVALAPLVGVGYVFSRGYLKTDTGPESTWKEVTPNLGWLLLGSVFAASLLNAGPIATTLLVDTSQPEEKAMATQFAYGVLLARIPLFMFQAVQAALLPRLSRLAARGELDEFRAGLKRLMVVVLGVGIVGTLGALVLGPFAIDLVYGADDLTGRTLAMLALGSACYMVALGLAQAVIALHGHALVAVGWIIGVIVFLLGTWLSSDDPFRRVEIGLVLSSMASMIAFAVFLWMRLNSGDRPDNSSVLEAITDMPLES